MFHTKKGALQLKAFTYKLRLVVCQHIRQYPYAVIQLSRRWEAICHMDFLGVRMDLDNFE